MNDVQFEDQTDAYLGGVPHKIKQTTMVRLAIKFGLAKDEHGANIFFIAVAIVSILLAVGVYMYYVAGYNPFASKVTTPVVRPGLHNNAI